MTKIKPKKILPVENCLRYWESLIFHSQALLSPSTRVIIQATIIHLRKEKDREDEANELIEKEIMKDG